jgi:hypothetical protein
MLTSCVTTQQKLSPAVYYRHDLCFEYETGKEEEVKVKDFFHRHRNYKYRNKKLKKEKVAFCGVGVLPYMEKYKIKVKAFGKLNFFSIRTCHEETTAENPDDGIFKKNGEIDITYTPTIERGKLCPLYFATYNRKQKHASGMVVFEDPRYQLKAKVSCNGYVHEYLGVSICASREGLLQEIEFNEPVKLVKPVVGQADRKKECPSLGEDYKKKYTFKLPNRECTYGFIGKDSKKIHMMYAAGHEDIIIRE